MLHFSRMKPDASPMDYAGILSHLIAAFGGGLVGWSLCRTRMSR